MILNLLKLENDIGYQNQAITALVKLRSHGITEEEILYVNNLLGNDGYNFDIKCHS
jgi:hypothetical protein